MKSTPLCFSESTMARPSAGSWTTTECVRMRGIQAIDQRTGNHHVRAEQFSIDDLRAPAFQIVEMSAHIAHTQDAISDKQRKRAVGLPDMHVHIPQAGNHVQAARVHDLRALRGVHFFRVADLRDAIPFHSYRLIRPGWRAGGVDDRHSVISSGLDANCLLCAEETSGTRQKTHRTAKGFTSSSGILTIYQLPCMNAFGGMMRQKFAEKPSLSELPCSLYGVAGWRAIPARHEYNFM